MASSNLVSALFLIFASSYPLAHGQTAPALSVSGQLCCTTTGNCPGQGIGGVGVNLTCISSGVTTTEGGTITDADGKFNITALAVVGVNLGIPRCVVTVPLPLNATVCPALSIYNGFLASTVEVAATVSAASIVLGRISGFSTYGQIV